VDSLRVIVTACGAPGTPGTIYSLANNWDGRRFYIVGTDIEEDVSGKLLVDKFYRVPEPENESLFVQTILGIVERESIDLIIPQATRELYTYSKYLDVFLKHGVKVLVSPHESIVIANDKYRLLSLAKQLGVPTPEFYLARDWVDIVEYAKMLGYPEKRVVVKPAVSHGSRGLRILDAKLDKLNLLLREKPTAVYTTLEEFVSIVRDREIPPYLVMEYLPGAEYTVDVLGDGEKVFAVIPRRRKRIVLGISFSGRIERREDIIEYAEKLSKALKLRYAFGFQFIENEDGVPCLIESNPRIQGTMAASTLAGANIIYGAVKIALGEELPVFNIKWGMEFYRYWGLVAPGGRI